MNYLAEILGFYETVQTHNLSSGQIALWHGLMYICNRTGWKPVFTAPNITLELVTGLSRSAIQKNREVLKEFGLIDYVPNGTKATLYRIKSKHGSDQDAASDKNENNEDMSKSVQDSVQDSGTFYKQKQKEKKDTKVSKEKNQSAIKKFVPPTVDEVRAYCQERGNNIDPEYFVDHYSSKGWMVGSKKMVDWKAAIRNWERNEKKWQKEKFTASISEQKKTNKFHNFEQRDTDYNQMVAEYYGYQDVAE